MTRDPDFDPMAMPDAPRATSRPVSWAALILPALIVLMSTAYILDYRDAHDIPVGTKTEHAKVLSSTHRTTTSDYWTLTFRTDAGETGRVTIDRGDVVPDEIEVYRGADHQWTTPATKSTVRYFSAFLGYPLAALLIAGFFVVRRRQRQAATG